MIGFLEEEEGVKSMGRLQVLIGTCVGVIIVGVGLFTKNTELLLIGIGLIGGEGIVKAVQRAGEK